MIVFGVVSEFFGKLFEVSNGHDSYGIALEGSEKAFDNSVVVAIAAPGHALHDMLCLQTHGT